MRTLLSFLAIIIAGTAAAIGAPEVSGAAPATLTVLTAPSPVRGASGATTNTAPTVTITPTPGNYYAGQVITVTITYCDTESLDTTTAVRQVNGVNKSWPVSYNNAMGNPGPCLAQAVVSGNVTLVGGSNIVRGTIEDADPVPLWSGNHAKNYIASTPWGGVSVVAENQYIEATTGATTTQKFTVQNLGDVSTTFTISASQTGLSGLVVPSGKGANLTLASMATGTVSIGVNAPSTSGASGRLSVTATGGGASGSAFTEITAVPTPSYTNGVTLVNPTGISDRSQCLAISTGAGAAMECGDLRLAYGLPGVVTRGRARAPSLVYSSASAHPYVTLPADLTLANPGSLGSTFTATVVFLDGPIANQSFAAGSWQTADFGGSAGKRRILATFDAASVPTGRHRVRLDIQMSGGSLLQTTGQLLMVNRLASTFNAGWWVGGLEQLASTATSGSAIDTLMWIGGDGSARLYAETNATSCVFTHEAFDVPEKLAGTPSGGSCTNLFHLYPDSLRVLFDAAGNHIETRNRLGESTTFTWSAGKLATITVPSGSVSRQFTFVYTGGVLDSIIAPDLPTQNRAVKLTSVVGAVVGGSGRSRTTNFRGPDMKNVAFTYEGGSTANTGDYRVVSRSNRMGRPTTFTYDASYKVATASTKSDTSTTITTTYRSAEGQGKGTGAAGQALALDSVYTRLDGPRTDVSDVMKWWVNRYGAPVRSRNPVGMETRIVYHGTFPALPATMTDAAGLTSVAVYNARGLVDKAIVRSPYGTADSAMTSITWDATWNKPLTVTDPNGLTTTNTYDAANGNLLSSRVGTNTSRTINYAYDATTKLLRRVSVPTGGADSLFYDAELGNLRSTRSPRGVLAWSYKDRLGRDTLIVTSVDTIIGTTTKQQLQRFAYDSAGRVVEARTSAPSMPYALYNKADDTISAPAAEEATTRTTYDAEGRPLTVHTFSTPNPLVVPDPFTPMYVESPCEQHCAGIPPGTVGSFDVRTYDWVGRPLSQRLGSGPSSVTYDLAGNVVSALSRDNYTMFSTFDAAGRLIKRVVPARTYGSEGCYGFAYGMLNGMPPSGQCLMTFPFYPTSGANLVIAADTVRFVFDAAGRMVRADNNWARVTRGYFANGAMSQETQAIRSYGTASFTTNVYVQTYQYDLGGRRLRHGLPFSSDSVKYAYSPETGALSEIRHGNDIARLYLDLAGRQDSLEILQGSTLGVVEQRDYDLDGQLTWLKRWRRDGSAFVNLLEDSITYDARGKLRRVRVTSASQEVGEQIITNHYSGLGAVVASSKRAVSNWQWESEEFRTSAIGTVYWSKSRAGSQFERNAQRTIFGNKGEVKSREALPSTAEAPYYTDELKSSYDLSGNTTHSSAVYQDTYGGAAQDRYYTATRSYYSADNRLMAVQRYHATDAGRSGAWEEFRYDALGRRVLSRTRRGQHGDAYVRLCGGTCPGWIERTIWDGNNALYEGRVEVDDTSSVGSDSFSSTGSNWGSVGYVHAGGYDRPIFTMDGRVPSYNWRGLPESSVSTAGAIADCALGPPCSVTVAWPSANTIYMRPSPFGSPSGPTPQWIGSVLADGAGSTGMLYRRNRYYDPASGQFTQQDPIGIAGGANVYGFVGGDPINFWDPFGLCKDRRGNDVECPNKDKVAKWMRDSAQAESKGRCANYCRRGLEAGGMDTEGRPVDAGDYGPFLLERGAGVVPSTNYTAATGDIAVFAKTTAHPYGHIQIYDGTNWISDFKQNGFNPYRDPKTAGASTIYRFPGTLPAVVVNP